MKSIVAFLLCCGSVMAVNECLAPSNRDALVGTFLGNLETRSYASAEGAFHFYDISLCEMAGTCLLQNPSTPYGFITLPFGPEEPVHAYTPPALVPQAAWRLASDEAVVMFFCSPPESRYFGYQHYVTGTFDSSLPPPVPLQWRRPTGSLGDAVNINHIKTFTTSFAPASTPFDANAVLVIASDQAVVNDIAQSLQASGLDPSLLNLLAIPADGLAMRMGLNDTSDIFSFLFRFNDPVSTAAYEAYRSSIPYRVLRVSRLDHSIPQQLFGLPALRSRFTPEPSEVSLLGSAAAELVSQVADAFSVEYEVQIIPGGNQGFGLTQVEWGGICYASKTTCLFDTRDAAYKAIGPAIPFTSAYDFVYVIGANHALTGNALFASVALYNLPLSLGVSEMNDVAMAASSASSWLGDVNIAATELYALRFARNCTEQLPQLPGSLEPMTACREVPATGFPSLPDNVPAGVITRAYLGSTGGAGPEATGLVNPTMVIVRDRCRPLPCELTATCDTAANVALVNAALRRDARVTMDGDLVTLRGADAIGNDGIDSTVIKTKTQTDPFYEIDLRHVKSISRIEVQTQGTLQSVSLLVTDVEGGFGDADFDTAMTLATFTFPLVKQGNGGQQHEFTVPLDGLPGRYVRIQADGSNKQLRLRDVQVYTYCSTL